MYATGATRRQYPIPQPLTTPFQRSMQILVSSSNHTFNEAMLMISLCHQQCQNFYDLATSGDQPDMFIDALSKIKDKRQHMDRGRLAARGSQLLMNLLLTTTMQQIIGSDVTITLSGYMSLLERRSSVQRSGCTRRERRGLVFQIMPKTSSACSRTSTTSSSSKSIGRPDPITGP